MTHTVLSTGDALVPLVHKYLMALFAKGETAAQTEH